MKKLRLSVCKKFHKCTSADGEWDRTWDESYEYIIYDEEGIEVPEWKDDAIEMFKTLRGHEEERCKTAERESR